MLRRWEEAEGKDKQLEGTLEELTGCGGRGKKHSEKWDQFKVNYELFGVVSTFKSDLSQYTTPLDTKRVSPEMRRRAERLAQEIDGGRTAVGDDGGEDGGEEDDEEDLWSSVPRHAGGAVSVSEGGSRAGTGSGGGGGRSGVSAAAGWLDGNWDTACEQNRSDPGADAGGALLALMRAAPAASKGDGDHRARVAPMVQGWWRARRLAGASCPSGAEEALICPFSRQVFGDVSRMVTHWAAALPRDGTAPGAPNSAEATEHFRHMGETLRWTDMAKAEKLDTMFSLDSPRAGSVWEQLVTRLQAREGKPLAERLVSDFVSEATQMRCWRRDQKVEHREILEGIAAGLALHILSSAP